MSTLQVKEKEPWIKGLNLSDTWTHAHWVVIKEHLKLPPGMNVEVNRRQGYLTVLCTLKTKDSYNPSEPAWIASSWPIYDTSISVRFMLHVIKTEVEKLWLHELHEWCKMGDQFLFGDPHA